MGYRTKDPVEMVPSMSMGKDVKDTKMLKGEASKDSLHGKNEVKEYKPGAKAPGTLGSGAKVY
jgi:hypothetical protein